MVKISKIAAFVTLSVFFAVYLTAAPLVTLRDVYFYLSKVPIGAEESHFKRGDTVYVVARPPITGATLEVEVLLFFPPEAGRTPLTLLSRTRVALNAERVIARYDIAPTDVTGKYAIRVRVWDPATGRLEEGDLPFEVIEEFPLIWAIIPAVVLLAAVGAVVLLRRRTSLAPPPPPTGAERVAPVEGPTVVTGVPGATVSVPAPSGETMRLVAMLELGDKVIPITSLPARFGREDFIGIVPSSVLSLISRRMPRGQFTIDYDYISGSFVIIDEGSTNGTFVNGEDIRGKGRVPIKDGDIISPANAFNLRFTVKAA
ncbi:MAG: FHA domain-containing protein [Thermosphaera sp.]